MANSDYFNVYGMCEQSIKQKNSSILLQLRGLGGLGSGWRQIWMRAWWGFMRTKLLKSSICHQRYILI